MSFYYLFCLFVLFLLFLTKPIFHNFNPDKLTLDTRQPRVCETVFAIWFINFAKLNKAYEKKHRLQSLNLRKKAGIKFSDLFL